jgi:hypothetical protein
MLHVLTGLGHRLHRAGFLSVCVAPDAPRTESKSQEVESIVSHPLKFAEGEAASVGLMEGRAGPAPKEGQNINVDHLSREFELRRLAAVCL